MNLSQRQVENRVVELLIYKGWQVAFAESCTGGLAAARIVDVPNASKVLSASFVTYSPEAKQQFVGVMPGTIEEFGIVSEQVALQMAVGAAKAAGAQVGVGITGIAGPEGGTEKIPVGTVCVGICAGNNIRSFTIHCGDMCKTRNEVRQFAVDAVMGYLEQTIKISF
ncbi:MAG: CinA family protein [Clostridia bacterium]|nr:CinA family protein [Clostridia bacterium]